MSHSVVTYTGGQVPAPIGHRNTGGEAEEEWVTKKKVDIVTTKSVERKVQRQIVLEDGRVVEEEVPVVTVDTTEDTQTFQTDQDEERELGGGQEAERSRSLATKFDTTGNVLVGDKFTRVKKINDVTESLVKTEALQNLGDIRSKDLKKCLDERDDIRKYLRSRVGLDSQPSQVIVAPKVLLNKRNHRVVTDQEDVQERNWMNKGKMQNERIKTEEHIEYDSDDSSESGSSSSSSKSSHNKLEPEVYKTRKDENFTEYFKIHKNQAKHIKIGEGPHYVSESKEVHRVDDNQLLFTPSRPSRARNQRNFLLTDYEPSRRPLTHTDSWLEKHFGSTSSLSQSSSELTGSRPGSRDGPGAGGLRRSASICDIRPVANSNGEFYATVRKSGKVQAPEVPMREQRPGRSDYTENRRSANFSSSGHPVPIRPPRRQKSGGQYGSLSRGSGSQSSDRHYSSLSFRKPADHNPTEKYYFGAPVTIKKYPGSGGLTRSYSSVQNIPGHTGHREAGAHTGRRPEYHNSTGNIYKSASVSAFRKSEPHHLIVNRDKPRSERREPRNKSESRDREKYHNGNNVREQYAPRDRDVRGGGYLQERTNNIRNRGPAAPRDIYSVPQKVTSSRENKSYKSSDIYTIGRDNRQDSSKEVYAVPHQIIYDTTSQGTPFTKFRTRIVINSET